MTPNNGDNQIFHVIENSSNNITKKCLGEQRHALCKIKMACFANQKGRVIHSDSVHSPTDVSSGPISPAYKLSDLS